MNLRRFIILIAVMTGLASTAYGGEMFDGVFGGSSSTHISYYRDCKITIKSASSAQGKVYVLPPEYNRYLEYKKEPASSAVLEGSYESVCLGGKDLFGAVIGARPNPGYAVESIRTVSSHDGSYFEPTDTPYEFINLGTADIVNEPKENPAARDDYQCKPVQIYTFEATFKPEKRGSIHVNTGQLSQQIAARSDMPYINNLKVTGTLDDSDMEALEQLARKGPLQRLDLSEANIKEIYSLSKTYLLEIILPRKGLEYIFVSAFADNIGLYNCDIPDYVPEVGDDIFENCMFMDEVKPRHRPVGNKDTTTTGKPTTSGGGSASGNTPSAKSSSPASQPAQPDAKVTAEVNITGVVVWDGYLKFKDSGWIYGGTGRNLWVYTVFYSGNSDAPINTLEGGNEKRLEVWNKLDVTDSEFAYMFENKVSMDKLSAYAGHTLRIASWIYDSDKREFYGSTQYTLTLPR